MKVLPGRCRPQGKLRIFESAEYPSAGVIPQTKRALLEW